MKKTLQKLLVCLCLCALLLPACLTRAEAADLDYIDRCDMVVEPSGEDGSLRITASFRWSVLSQGPVDHLQIGIPNGSVRETTPLSSNIDDLGYDNSYMYVYFNERYDDGETFEFSYSWVQEYMYTLDGSGAVSYSYTPGWFDEAEIGEMTVTWRGLGGAAGAFNGSFSGVEGTAEPTADGGARLSAQNLPHGAQMTIAVDYSAFPATLSADMSAENMPEDSYGDYDDYSGYDNYEDDDGGVMVVVFVIIFFIVVAIIILAAASDGYNGGFGPTYIFYNGLWYPRGPGGKPRPGSVGVPHKPAPPPRSGGFGGGSRGGGFGGGGFGGGGGHCACASSCACACACACAGGGRAGCSAKNLYGAVRLSRDVTEQLSGEAGQD